MKEKQTIGINCEKKTYTPPKLIKYGEVRSITQTGSSGPNENAAADKPNYMAQSDRSTKKNIVKIGDHPSGFGIYLFDFRPEFREVCGYGRQFGVMADEVESIIPEAVSVGPNGYKMVNYKMIGISRSTH